MRGMNCVHVAPKMILAARVLGLEMHFPVPISILTLYLVFALKSFITFTELVHKLILASSKLAMHPFCVGALR